MLTATLDADSTCRRVAAVVLGAGASSRMGRPKATLRLAGERFVDRVVATVGAAGCRPILVVQGAHHFEPPPGSILITNAAWRLGALSSLQAALGHLHAAAAGEDRELSGVLVCSVDRPRVHADTLSALIRAHASAPECVWQPRQGGRRGHPILWPLRYCAALLELDAGNPHTSARTLLHRPDVAADRRFVDVDDPHIHDNIDELSDLDGLE